MVSEVSDTKAEEIVNAMLVGSYFVGLHFNTSFVLDFFQKEVHLERGSVELKLHLDCGWHCGDFEEWTRRVEEFTPKGSVQPDEPMQAFELAHLRWSGQGKIVKVRIDGGYLSLSFESGLVIKTDNSTTHHEWRLTDAEDMCADGTWAVTCEETRIYIKDPNS